MRGKDLLECMEYIDDELIQEALEPATVKNNIFVKWGMAAACVVVIGISATVFWSQQIIKDERLESAGDTASPMAMNNAENLSESGQVMGAATTDTQADTDGGETSRYTGNGLDDLASAEAMADEELSKEDIMIMDTEAEEAKLAYTIINSYYGEKDDSIYDYPAPEKGEYFCYHDLQKTMEYYAARESEASSINTTSDAAKSMYAYEVVIDLYGDVEMDGEIQYKELGILDNTTVGNEMVEQEYRRLIELGYAVRLSEDFQLTGTFTKVEIDTFQALPKYGYVFRFMDEG